MLVLIYGDEANPHPEDSAVLRVSDTDSYLRARIRIADHLKTASTAASPLKIYILKERYRSWFADLQGIGQPFVAVSEESLRRRIEEAWKTTLPSSLSSEELRALDLEKLPPPRPGLSVSHHILKHKLGKAWRESTAGPAHAVQLLHDDLAKPGGDRLEEKEGTWLSLERRKIVNEWKAAAPKTWRPFYRSYDDDRGVTLRAVCVALYLMSLGAEERYDQSIIKEYLYDHPLPALNEEKLVRLSAAIKHAGDREQLERLTEAGRRPTSVYLLRYWKTKLNGLERDLLFLDGALELLPGQTAEEVQALEQLLDESGVGFSEPLTQAQYEALHQRFGALIGTADVLDRLAAQVLPDLPSEPDQAWREAPSLDPWIPWLLNEYLPYRTAIDRLCNRVSPDQLAELERRATCFSDWYCRHYSHMLHEGRDLVTTVGRKVAEHLEHGERVVWLIWDNLPAEHTAGLLKILQTQDFHPAQETTWKLALLPSVTRISFSASLSGLRPDESEAVSSNDYSALITQQFPRYHTIYRNSLSNMESVLRKPNDLYVFHYRQHDTVLHTSESQLEDTRKNVLDMHSRNVAEQLARAFLQMPADRPISLVISTDHGSTLLPQQIARSIPMPRGAELVEEHSSRAVVIGPSFDETGTAAYDPEACTYLDPATFGLSAPVLLARGFRSWSRTRRGSGYVHGGALPEEVLVPLLLLKKEQRSFEPLTVDLAQGKLRRSELGEVTLRITNKNDFVVDHVDLHLTYEGRRLLTKGLPRLPANTSIVTNVGVRIEPQDSIRNGQVELKGTVSAQLLGRIERMSIRIVVPASERAVHSRTNEDLDEFFN